MEKLKQYGVEHIGSDEQSLFVEYPTKGVFHKLDRSRVETFLLDILTLECGATFHVCLIYAGTNEDVVKKELGK
jgi:hypothetical protein